jgi:hypothetical protein
MSLDPYSAHKDRVLREIAALDRDPDRLNKLTALLAKAEVMHEESQAALKPLRDAVRGLGVEMPSDVLNEFPAWMIAELRKAIAAGGGLLA